MKVDAGRGRMYDALEQLGHRWEDVEPLWNDQVRQQFEEKIFEPLNILTQDAMRAIDRLSQIFTQARHEIDGEWGMGGPPS